MRDSDCPIDKWRSLKDAQKRLFANFCGIFVTRENPQNTTAMPYARKNLKKKGPKVSLSQNNGLKWRKGTAAKGPLKVYLFAYI